MNDYNPWPVGSEWWYIIEEMRKQSRERRIAEGKRALEKIMREVRGAGTTEECPCCQGTGRLGIVIGARDDAR